jgi:uncharacterized lipoprotein YehR (DUF1307 family)
MDILHKNLKTIIALCVIMVLFGCNDPQRQDPKDLPENYSCTKAELELVQKDFTICEQSSYFSDYCFLQAKKSQCTYLGEEHADVPQ